MNSPINRRPLTDIQVPDGVQWIVLDAVGTLIRPKGSVPAVYRQAGLARQQDVPLDIIERRFQTAISSADWTVPSNDFQKSTWKAIVADVFCEAPSETVHELFDELWRVFSAANAWCLFPDVPVALRQWHEDGYRMVIGSNFDDRIPEIVKGLPELRVCQALFWSSGVGYAKPDTRFFRHIESRLGGSPSEMLMIGDTHEMDIVGALGAGWHAESV